MAEAATSDRGGGPTGEDATGDGAPDGSARASRLDAGAFWLSVIAVPAASVLTVVALARRLGPGELAAVSAVFGLSFVAAVVPMAAQAQAAADGAADPELAVGRPRWRPLQVGTLLAVLAAPVVALALGIPVLAALLPAAGVLPAVTVGAARGELIAHRRFRAAAVNQLVEAAVRLVTGIALGWVAGASGVAAALLLAALAAWVALPAPLRDPRHRPVLALPVALTASALLTVSVHLDVFLAPRLLGGEADAYAVAALPAKGVFLALMAAGWLVIPDAPALDDAARRRRPVLLTAAAGVVLAAIAAAAAPVLGVVLGRPQPDRGLVLLLGLAMAAAAGSWVALQLRLTRGGRLLWLPAAVAIGATVALGVATRSGWGLAAGLVAGQLLGLAVALRTLGVEVGARIGADVADRPGEAGGIEGGVVIDLRHEPAVAQRPVTAAPAADLPPATRTVAPATTVAATVEPTRWGGITRCPRSALVGAAVALVVGCLLQQPGRIVPETKLDVTLDAGRFLARTFHLWEPLADLGNVQNQAVGYLFPMGPFFVAGQVLGIPAWALQRLWMGLLLTVAFWGVARLADELRIGSVPTRLLAAAAYALSPFFLARVGITSAMVIGGALAPWVLLPLVQGARGGSPRRAAARSGVAVLAIGGINGAVSLAVLVLPALYLLTRTAGPRRRQLAGWWAAAVVAATAWWIIPLVFQLRYGFNFLPFTERAATTTSVTSLVEVVRGTGDWLSYLHLREAWLPGGWMAVAAPVTVAGTLAVAGAGLVGLTRRDLPERMFLVLSFAGGIALVGAGYGGWLGDPAALAVRQALDGPLGMFRNVYKFQPVVGLPLALAGGHAAMVAGRWARRAATVGHPVRAVVARALPAVAVVAVAAAALPLLSGSLTSDKGFSEVPRWWQDAAAALPELSHGGRALLVPGASTADYSWGRPLDEPLQVLAGSPWAVRSLIPLGGPGSTRVLDGVEQVIERGGDPALPDVLARAGITTVVARNDVRWREWGAPRPAQVDQALRASGLTPVASFGPLLPVDGDAGDPGFGVGEVEHDLHTLVVYGVPGPGLVQSLATADTAVVSGGPESLLALARAGLADRPVVLAGDLPADQPLPTTWIVTDTLRRAYVEFGLMRANDSYTLAPDEPGPGGRSLGPQLVPTAGAEHQTVAELEGVAGVRASSYGSWLYQLPEVAPDRALDGDPATAWVAGPVDGSTGEWLQVDLEQPLQASTIDVSLLEDGPWRPRVRALRLTTEAGTVVDEVAPVEAAQQVALPAGPTRWVRIGFERLDGDAASAAGAGIREVGIPGVTATRRLVAPSELADRWRTSARATPVYLFERATTNPRSLLRRDEERQLDRAFVLPRSADLESVVTATPQPGPALLDLLDPGGRGLTATASTTFQELPEYAPQHLVDGSDGTLWVAQPPDAGRLEVPPAGGRDDVPTGTGSRSGDRSAPVPQRTDPQPTIHLRWGEVRTVDQLVVGRAAGFSAPRTLRLSSPDGERVVDVPPDGIVRFDALSTDRLDVAVTGVDLRTTISPIDGRPTPLPVGLASLRLPALADLVPAPADPQRTIRIGCGEGPTLTVDGTTLRYSVTTTAAALAALTPVTLTPCDPPTRLAGGRHTLHSASGDAPLTITTVELRDPAAPGVAAGRPARRTAVQDWTEEDRSVDVGAGDESFLAVSENFNAGWTAELDGRPLRAVRLDGWRQAFVVPAGPGGTVHLHFAPATPYRVALLAGLALALLLAAGALVADRAHHERRIGPASWSWRVLAAVLGVVAVVTTGLGAVLAVPLVRGARRWRWLPPAAAAGGIAVAAAAVLAAPGRAPADATGAFGPLAALGASLAVLAVLTSAVDVPAGWRPGRRHAAVAGHAGPGAGADAAQAAATVATPVGVASAPPAAGHRPEPGADLFSFPPATPDHPGTRRLPVPTAPGGPGTPGGPGGAGRPGAPDGDDGSPLWELEPPGPGHHEPLRRRSRHATRRLAVPAPEPEDGR